MSGNEKLHRIDSCFEVKVLINLIIKKVMQMGGRQSQRIPPGSQTHNSRLATRYTKCLTLRAYNIFHRLHVQQQVEEDEI